MTDTPLRKTSRLAIASCICAILPLWPISSILAILFASKARYRIINSQGTLGGGNLAMFGKVFGLMSLCVSVVALLATPALVKERKKVDAQQALNCSRSVYLCFLDFEGDMGSFPDDQTAKENPELHEFTGSSSNRYLGQLIAGGYLKSESHFSIRASMKTDADDVIQPSSEILKAGENGWAYVMVSEGKNDAPTRGLSTRDSRKLTLLLAPMTDPSGEFSTGPFGGYYLALYVDGSVRKNLIKAGNNNTFSSEYWNENFRPVVKMPE